jgi:hypothetical protein
MKEFKCPEWYSPVFPALPLVKVKGRNKNVYADLHFSEKTAFPVFNFLLSIITCTSNRCHRIHEIL